MLTMDHTVNRQRVAMNPQTIICSIGGPLQLYSAFQLRLLLYFTVLHFSLT